MEIWKFPFEIEDCFEIEMPFSAKILTVQYQGNTPCIWAIVDTGNSRATMKFRVLGSGHYINSFDGLEYIGTIQQPDLPLVWHIFEDIKPSLSD